jgi:hypothetical protein
VKGILGGLLLVGVVISCSYNTKHVDEMTLRMEKMNLINHLWTEIRDWRADKVMMLPLDPPASMLMQVQEKTVKDSGKVCPDNRKIPATCSDTCTLSDHICENADQICKIADELGKNDRAQEKCTSAKASCREGKQKCCNCTSKPPVIEPPAVETAPGTR